MTSYADQFIPPPRSANMSDVKRYPIFELVDDFQHTRVVPRFLVNASDYATLEAECRWAHKRFIEERNCYYDFVCFGGKGEIEERKANDQEYQRAQAWLDTHKEG